MEQGLLRLTLTETLIGFTLYVFILLGLITILCLVINKIFGGKDDSSET
jgi:hypothetical protein